MTAVEYRNSQLASRWYQAAFICRYGNQDVYRILGRDPLHRPMTAKELKMFELALLKLVESEFTPKDADGVRIDVND